MEYSVDRLIYPVESRDPKGSRLGRQMVHPDFGVAMQSCIGRRERMACPKWVLRFRGAFREPSSPVVATAILLVWHVW